MNRATSSQVASCGDDVPAGHEMEIKQKIKAAQGNQTCVPAGHDVTAHQEPEKPLEVVFRPALGLAMVLLRNPMRPEPEIEYLKQAPRRRDTR
jgi:hypothetical protein